MTRINITASHCFVKSLYFRVRCSDFLNVFGIVYFFVLLINIEIFNKSTYNFCLPKFL